MSDKQNTPNKGATSSLAIKEEERVESHLSLLHTKEVIYFNLTVVLTHKKTARGIIRCEEFIPVLSSSVRVSLYTK